MGSCSEVISCPIFSTNDFCSLIYHFEYIWVTMINAKLLHLKYRQSLLVMKFIDIA